MRKAALNALYYGVGGAFLSVVLMMTFLPIASWGTEGTDPADGVGMFALVLSGFSYPVLLSLDWWVTVGLLAVAFRMAHRRGGAPGG